MTNLFDSTEASAPGDGRESTEQAVLSAQLVAAIAAGDEGQRAAIVAKLEGMEARGLLVTHGAAPMRPGDYLSAEQRDEQAQEARALAARNAAMGLPTGPDGYPVPPDHADQVPDDHEVVAACRGVAMAASVNPQQWASLVSATLGTALRSPAPSAPAAVADHDEGADVRNATLTPAARAALTEHQTRVHAQRLAMGYDDSPEPYGIPASVAHLAPADDPTLQAARQAAQRAGVTPAQWRALCRQFFSQAVLRLPAGR